MTIGVGEKLHLIYERLYEAHGPQRWWPAEEPFEVIVGAILTQSTAWTNVEKAIANLKAADLLSPQGLLIASMDEIAQLIHPAGYYNVKARKIKAFVERLFHGFEGDLGALFALSTEGLRRELLSIFGIGPETADSILLYAAGKPIFVVDAYTRRLLSRLGLVAEDASYEVIQAVFLASLPEEVELFNEYHALIVQHCKVSCKKIPVCDECVLGTDCKRASPSGAIQALPKASRG